MRANPTPYRIVVFTAIVKVTGKGKRQKTRIISSAYMGWTSRQYYSEARLESGGSFLYPGMRSVRYAAYAYLALPNTHQLVIKTNQDKTVFRYFKSPAGVISGYKGDM